MHSLARKCAFDSWTKRLALASLLNMRFLFGHKPVLAAIVLCCACGSVAKSGDSRGDALTGNQPTGGRDQPPGNAGSAGAGNAEEFDAVPADAGSREPSEVEGSEVEADAGVQSMPTVTVPDPTPPDEIAAQCTASPTGSQATPTEGDFRALLLGQWYLCDDTSVFGTTDDVGLEFMEDGTWHKLVPDAEGNIAPAQSWEQSGTWSVVDTSLFNGPGVFQLNIQSIDGTMSLFPQFAEAPAVMRLDNFGVFVANYLRFDAESTKVTGVTVEPPPDVVPLQMGNQEYQDGFARCGVTPARQHLAASPEEYRQLLLGRWLVCDSPSAFGSTDEVGVEFTADGRWYDLVLDEQGTIVRNTDWANSGTFFVHDDFEAAPGVYQLDMTMDAGNTYIVAPRLADDPRAMRINNSGSFQADYVQID